MTLKKVSTVRCTIGFAHDCMRMDFWFVILKDNITRQGKQLKLLPNGDLLVLFF